jgi:hypothetical protein
MVRCLTHTRIYSHSTGQVKAKQRTKQRFKKKEKRFLETREKVWEYMGIWEYGNMGIWELTNQQISFYIQTSKSCAANWS